MKQAPESALVSPPIQFQCFQKGVSNDFLNNVIVSVVKFACTICRVLDRPLLDLNPHKNPMRCVYFDLGGH